MVIKKKLFVLVVLLLTFLNLLNVQAEVTVDKNSSVIETSYTEGEYVKGRINISFSEDENKRFTSSFEGGTKLYDLLKNSSASFSCDPINCKDTFSATAGTISKEFSLVNGKKIGFLFNGKIENINTFLFNLSDVFGGKNSCENQINLDLFADGSVDFVNYAPSNEVCASKPKGNRCFEDDEPKSLSVIGSRLYCGRMNVSAAAGYRVSAKIKKESANEKKLTFYIYDYSNLAYAVGRDCTPNIDVGQNGEVNCDINFSSSKNFEAMFCVSDTNTYAETEIGYQINSETHDYCGGHMDLPTTKKLSLDHDYEIFIQPLMYAPVNKIVFNNDFYKEIKKSTSADIKAEIRKYLNETNKLDCDDGCIFPMAINGSLTNLRIDSAKTKYASSGSETSDDKIYDLTEKPFTISMNSSYVDVEKMKFLVPDKNGTHDFYLCFNKNENCGEDNFLILKKVNVLVGFSFSAGPRSVIAGQKTFFIVQSTKNITSTKWNFGDGSSAVTSGDNKAEHTYKDEKEYIIEVTATVKTGETSTKKFKIIVGDTKTSINLTISKYKKRLGDSRNEIKTKPEWIKKELDENFLKLKDDELIKINNEYVTMPTNSNISEYSKILTRLLDLNVPYIIRTSDKGSDTPLVVGYKNMNLNYMKEISGIEGETIDDSQANSVLNDEDIKNGIVEWTFKNYDARVDFETISGSYDEGNENIMRIYTVKLNKIEGADETEASLIISHPPSAIKFKENYEKEVSKGNSAVFVALKNDDPQIVEFMIKGSELPSVEELGMYISPDISEISTTKPLDENLYEKLVRFLWARFVTGIIILLVIFISVYILLQQWYKKNYEKHLFKNPDDLYNLINFVYNSRKIGMNDKESRKKLEDKKWKGEQLSYVFKKIDGKRTGMFEIPIFKFRENKKVKQEIEKRQKEPIDTRFIKMKN